MILGSFEGNHRSHATWRSASGLLVDLDFEDPAVPSDEGAHQAVPDDLRPRIADALASPGEPVLRHERQGIGAILAGMRIDLRMRLGGGAKHP